MRRRLAATLAAGLALAPAAAARAADEVTAPPYSFGLTLGLASQLGPACRQDGDIEACNLFLVAWAARVHALHTFGSDWAVGLALAFGTDIDQTESVSSTGGRITHGRQFVDLMLRLRLALFGLRGWAAAEAGTVMARETRNEFAPTGTRTHGTAARQYAPAVALIGGVAVIRNETLAVDVEAGVRVTAFGREPPLLPGPQDTGARATEYGVHPWLWLGLGARFGG